MPRCVPLRPRSLGSPCAVGAPTLQVSTQSACPSSCRPAAAYRREPGGRGAAGPSAQGGQRGGEGARAGGVPGLGVRWRGRRPPQLGDCASAPPAPAAPGCAEAAAAAMAMVPPALHPPGRPASSRAVGGAGVWAARWRRRGGAAATLQVRSCGPRRRRLHGNREGRARRAGGLAKSAPRCSQPGPCAPAVPAQPAEQPSGPGPGRSHAPRGRGTPPPPPVAWPGLLTPPTLSRPVH